MGCDYTVYVGEIPIKGKCTDLASLLLGHYVEVDYEKVSELPHIVIGEASFLKASLTGDRKTFIPGVIDKLSRLIPTADSGNTIIIDDALIAYVREAVKTPNESSYEVYKKPEEIVKFFEDNKGKPCFAICQ
jgi:hypothetical protein